VATSPPITDLRRTHPGLYRAPDTPVRLTVPPLQYLMLDGAGDPRLGPAYPGDPQLAPAFMDAVLTLYAVSYGLRFMVKDAGGEPWTVMPLEGLWWADDMAGFSMERRENWLWTAMIAQPSVGTADLVADAVAAAVRKGKAPSAEGLRLEVFDEGDSAQVMHHGPFTDEGPTIARLHAFIADAGLQRRGKHHEVYLSNARRTSPEKLRTILRQPVLAG